MARPSPSQSISGIVLDQYLTTTLADVSVFDHGSANAAHLAKIRAASANVGRVVRLSPTTDSRIVDDAFALYVESFPSEDEREPIELIKARVKTQPAAFHAHIYLDKQDRVIGYCQGSIVQTVGEQRPRVFFFLQYCAVSPAARGGGILQLMHAVNSATLVACARRLECEPLGSLWETEPVGLGDDAEARKFTAARLIIHNKAGGRVMIGQRRSDKSYLNLHIQPRLTADSNPITLHVMFRPIKFAENQETSATELDKATALAIMLGFIANFTVEGFDANDVKEARDNIQRRFDSVDTVWLLPAADTPDGLVLSKTDPMLRSQMLAAFKVASLAQVSRDF